jgi:hypothetical protein
MMLRGWCDAIVTCNVCRAFPMLISDLDPWSIWHPFDDGADHQLVIPGQGTLEDGRYPGSVKFVPSPGFQETGGFVTIVSRSADHATALTTLWVGLQLPITQGDRFQFADTPADLWGRGFHQAFPGPDQGFSNDTSNPLGIMSMSAIGSPAQIQGMGAHRPRVTFTQQAVPNVGGSFGHTREIPGFLIGAYLDDTRVPDLKGRWFIVGRHGIFNPRDEWLNMSSVRRYCRVLSQGFSAINAYVWAPGEYRAAMIDDWGVWHLSDAGWRIDEPGQGVSI